MRGVFVIALFASAAVAASGHNCKGKPTGLPILDATPELVQTAANAKLFSFTGITPNILVAHVYGSGRERGRAYGTILKPYLRQVADAFFAWVQSDIENAVTKYVPKDIADLIAVYGLDAVLDLQYLLMKNHISDEFKAEVEGIAETSGLSFDLIMRLTVFPDMVKAHCSMVGAWGNATPDGSLVQLRALDWATNSPLQKWPLITVFHNNGTSFSTLGWPLFLGALTGMSSRPLGVCEKVWLSYDGKSRRNG